MSAVLIEPMEFPSRLEIPGMAGTEEDFWELCQSNPNQHIEREANGDITVMAPSGWETSEYNANLVTELRLWARHHGGTVIESSGGFKLPNGATRAPDAAWLSQEKRDALSKEERRRFPRVVPEFIAEIVSPSDSLKKQEEKMAEYMANGAQLGWLIIPDNCEVRIYRSGGTIEVVKNSEKLEADAEIMPGFVMDFSLIW